MAQAEQVLTDVARQAGGLVQDLWRRRLRGEPDLPEMLRQLELVITGAFGIRVQLELNRAPEASKSRSLRLFGSDEVLAPRHSSAVPATDGFSIWLPAATEDADIIRDFDNLRIMALQQAARAHRRSSSTLPKARDPLVRAIYEVLEADAADIDLVTRFRGLTAQLNGFRRLMLEQRPAPSDLDIERRPLEQWVHEILEIPCEAAAQSREHPATRSLQIAAELAPELLKDIPDVPRTLAGILQRDLWIGELRPEPGPMAGQVIEARSPDVIEPDVLEIESSPLAVPTDTDLDRTVFMDAEDLEPVEMDAAELQATQVDPRSLDTQKIEVFAATDDISLPVWLDETEESDAHLDPSIEITQPLVVGAVAIRSLAVPDVLDADLLIEELAAQQTPAPVPFMDAATQLLTYPEWDYSTASYQTTGTTVALLAAPQGPEGWVDETLDRHHALVQGMRQRFEALRAQRRETDEVGVDGHVDAYGDARAGLSPQVNAQAARADTATLLLIEVGAASQEWVSSTHQLIDLQREAVLLACLALYSLGEPYSVFVCSSDGAQRTGLRCLKQFDEAYSDDVALRIAGMRPEPHARTGAALRHATALLAEQTVQHRMLLLLSDGAAHDADDYHGRYGMEDIRQAVREARMQGISSVSFSTDQLSGNYLPTVFGEQQSTVLYRPELLPSALTQWLHRLMRL